MNLCIDDVCEIKKVCNDKINDFRYKNADNKIFKVSLLFLGLENLDAQYFERNLKYSS
jgi:hypothetical protein